MPRLPWYVDMLLHDQHDLATFNRSLAHTSKVQLPARFISTCLRRALQSVITGEPFGNMPLGEVLDRTRRRVARSISFRSRRRSAELIWTWRPPLSSHPRDGTQRRPTRCQLAAVSRPHHQWIQPHFRSVPKVIKFSVLHANTKQRDARRLQALRNGP